MAFPSAPPFDLVQLSTLPQETWKGRAVFHPMEQGAGGPVWEMSEEDFAERLSEFVEDDRSWQTRADYDAGVVLDWEPDQHFADMGVIRVRFVMASGSTLRYSSDNLWTPKLWCDRWRFLGFANNRKG